MIKNYAGFSTDLEGEKLIEYLKGHRDSCRRLVKSYTITEQELQQHIEIIINKERNIITKCPSCNSTSTFETVYGYCCEICNHTWSKLL